MYNWAIRRIILNSFETDIKRTVISMPFVVGIILEIGILWVAGFDSGNCNIALFDGMA